MKILGGHTQANPAILLVAMRSLNRTGALSYTDLESRLRPTSIIDTSDSGLRATLTVGNYIGLLDKSADDRWSLAAVPQLPAALGSQELFRTLVRKALLDRARSDVESQESPSDVAVGLAWWCTLDPARPVNGNWDAGTEKLVRDSQMGEVIVNKTQWTAFRRWLVYLGFGTKIDASSRIERFSPHPTRALVDVLRALPRSMPARDFLDAVIVALPVLDGGLLNRHLNTIGVQVGYKGDAMIGPAFGHALDRLQLRGALDLVRSDDGRSRVTYRSGGRTRTFDLVRQAGAQ